MAKKPSIPSGIKREVQRIVDQFNEGALNDLEQYCLPRFRGRFLYLDRSDHGRVGPICRLEYRGSMDNWKFSIYKFSKGSYDCEEWFFPGSDIVDGTVEGAMKAGLEAYR